MLETERGILIFRLFYREMIIWNDSVATWNNLSICLNTEENQENLCLDDRSQDLRMHTDC
jgi:hypothetical protein